MPRDHRVLLDDIATASGRIEQYTSGISLQDFRTDPMRVDAVVRNLEIIGEAAKKLPETVRNGMSEIPWQRIARIARRPDPRIFRNRRRYHVGCRSNESPEPEASCAQAVGGGSRLIVQGEVGV